MKKAVPIILVLAAIAAAAFVFFRRQPPSGIEVSSGRAAELAPADSLVFVELPDITRSLKRWDETSLHQIAMEPEWKEFTGKMNDLLLAEVPGKDLMDLMQQVKEADPGAVFWALSAVPSAANPMPSFVGGFPFAGKKTAVKAAIEKVRGLLLKGAPNPKSEIVQAEGTDIETLKGEGFSLAFAYRDNWFFFASGLEPMKGLLQRYAGGPNAPPSLAKDALYAGAITEGALEPDFAAFVRVRKMIDEVVPAAPGFWDDLKPDAIVYTLKMDGPLLRDRLYFKIPKLPKAEALENRLLAFTSPQTYAYAALNTAGWEDLYRKGLKENPPLHGNVESLAAKGVKFEDFLTVFGPELALHSDWESDVQLFPTLFASVEVKDAAKARAVAEWIVEDLKKEGPLAQKEEDGTTYWTANTPVPLIHPTLALNSKYLIFGLNYEIAATGVKQMKTGASNLSESPLFQTAKKSVVPATAGTFYLDSKLLFERLYQKAKPMIAMQLAGNEGLSKYLDAGKLPKAETISKHLQPLMISYGNAPEGMVLDSAGSISLYGTLVPAGLGFTFMRGMVPSPNFAPPPASVTPAAPAAPATPEPPK